MYLSDNDMHEDLHEMDEWHLKAKHMEVGEIVELGEGGHIRREDTDIWMHALEAWGTEYEVSEAQADDILIRW